MTVPRLAVTLGDPAGIGPEVLVKAFAALPVDQSVNLFVVGSLSPIEQALEEAGLDLPIHLIDQPEAAQARYGIELLDPFDQSLEGLKRGEASALGGAASVCYFETAVGYGLAGRIDGIVTCPINKVAVQRAGFLSDIGHQEILARLTGAQLTATMLMTQGLKVAHLSTHLSLAKAVEYVRAPILMEKLKLTHAHLVGWGYPKPVIGVAALNPHGGEAGMLGREELDEIAPAIQTLQAAGLDIRGPYPADSIFNRAIAGEFDAVLALYHDQGHIPIKVHNFSSSVTATMGIPFVRTSVDHGTAFDIVGQGRADHEGLLQALRAAQLMLQHRLAEF
ncbi:4-hydroxythreonine-4-phosphate dehydrogenase PdxA [Pseudomonadales bacterium]|nr:4-hydroxythreonine-4-phosphate dehydrogenase PdxA [Pseudomonadales bacterium]